MGILKFTMKKRCCNRVWLDNSTQLAIALLVCGGLLTCAQEVPFTDAEVLVLSEGAGKRSGGRSFQLVADDVNLDGFGDEKRGGGRSFQSLAEDKRGGGRNFQLLAEDKRGGGRSFQFAEQKRAGGRQFQSFTNEDYKRAGGRSFVPVDIDKRGGARPFQMNAEDKRAGGRAFQLEKKRGGGRSFQQDKRDGGGAFQALAENKRAGGRAFQFSDDTSGEKRGGGRDFAPYAADFDYFASDKRAGARPFFGDSGWKRAGGRYFSRNFYNGMDDMGAFGFRKRAGGRPMYKRAGGRAFFGGAFGDAVPYYSRSFYPEYMKKAPYLFDDDRSSKVATSSLIRDNNFLSELKRTQQLPIYWSEQEKRAGGRTFPIDDDDSKEKRMLSEITRY